MPDECRESCSPQLLTSVREFIYDWSSCHGHVPIELYKTDFKLLFILIAIYTSLVAQLRQTANQEADGDVDSGDPFMINEKWEKHSINGGVSDGILWNCRSHSKTHFYYRSLYLSLILCFLIIAVLYLAARVIITIISFRLAIKLSYKPKFDPGDQDVKKIYVLEVAANAYKSINECLTELKEAKKCYLESERNEKESKDLFEKIDKAEQIANKKWSQHLAAHGDEVQPSFRNWIVALYIIPRAETIIMIILLTLSLTSYDPHPLGCLSPIEVLYNDTQMAVTLKISQTVMNYQQACVLISVMTFILWGILKTAQYFMLRCKKQGTDTCKNREGCEKGWSLPWKRRRREDHTSTIYMNTLSPI